MNFKAFCESYEESEKENVLTQQEIELLKKYDFKVGKNKKLAIKNYEGSFFIEAFSDKFESNLVLKKLHGTMPDEQISSVKNKFITEKMLSNFLMYAEQKMKTYK